MATTLPSSHNPFRTPNLTPQHTAVSTGDSDALSIPDDAPPAYTPTANPHQGEAAVEFGPRRPWQQAPPPLAVVTPQPTGVSAASVHTTSAFSPPPRRPSPPPASSSTYAPPPGRPPPRHPATSTPSSASQLYAPPPGQPPRRAASSASTSPSRTGGTPDDGRPTTTPMPGHPLLRGGKMLVYPVGYECAKCLNTGYKANDPSHPCRKCWERHAKPYAGALTYAPSPSSSPSSSHPSGNFQRPLPKLRPPHSHTQERPRSYGGYPGAAHHQHHSSFSSPHPSLSPAPAPQQQIHISPHPPPGSLVLPPGDPRIGGRLCWRCSGRGSTTYMIFDVETCVVCKGVGRVFN